MNRTKLLNILSSMLVGVVFIIAMLAVMILSGAVSLTRTELVFSTSSAEAVYDGKPLTNHTWSLDSGMLKEGHRARVSFTGKQTTAGESDNTIQVQILDAAGADVTGDYTIRYKLGRLKVTPRELTVKSKGASKVYDGTPLLNPDYEIGDIISGHNALVMVMGSQTEIGYSLNSITLIRITDRSGADVTDNYRITKQEEPLIVTGSGTPPNGEGGVNFGTPEDIDPDELANTVLYRIFSDRTGKVYLKTKSYGDYRGTGFEEAEKYTPLMSEIYSASYLMSFALQAKNAGTGEITVQRVGGDYALPYYMVPSELGGSVIQKDDVAIMGSANEYTVKYYLDDVTPAGHKRYVYRAYEQEYSEFVYANYLSIDAETKSYMDGVIASEGFKANDTEIINKVAAFIQGSALYNMRYDRALDSCENVAVAFLRDYKEGVCAHYATAATMLYRALGIPARYTVGVYADTVAGEWVDVNALTVHAWVEVYVDGIGWKMVEVTGGGSGSDDVVPDKEIFPVNVDKVYDGTPLSAKNALDGFEEYAKMGYYYKDLVISGTQTEVGTSYSTIESITVYDADGKDVTAEFILGKGTVRVYRGALAPASVAKRYDGKPLSAENEIAGFDEFAAAGYRYEMLVTEGERTDPGISNSKITSIVIYDPTDRDVTDEFKLLPGKVQVYREILAPVSVYKVYDGTPLYAEAELSGFSKYALEGYYYENLTVNGSRTEAGISKSTVESVAIYDFMGTDVTDEFIFGKGTVQVYLWEVTVTSDSASFEYGDIGGQGFTVTGDTSARYKFILEYTADYGEIGEQQNTFKVTVKDFWGLGEDITDRFRIKKVYGKLNIERREITVTAGSAEKAYDGTPLTSAEYSVVGTLAEGDSVYLCEMNGEQTNIGRSANEIVDFQIRDAEGKDVTDKYKVNIVAGTLRVTRPQ
jgi:uncharacterized protein YnzC (UPF0291/DUF896 family)